MGNVGFTALTSASSNKHIDCVRLLIRAGAKVEATVKGESGTMLSAIDYADDNEAILSALRKHCGHCKRGLCKSLKCSRCVSVAYCSPACQRDHYLIGHKAVCVARRQCDGCRWGIADEVAMVECCAAAAASAADAAGVVRRYYCNVACRLLGRTKHASECVERKRDDRVD